MNGRARLLPRLCGFFPRHKIRAMYPRVNWTVPGEKTTVHYFNFVFRVNEEDCLTWLLWVIFRKESPSCCPSRLEESETRICAARHLSQAGYLRGTARICCYNESCHNFMRPSQQTHPHGLVALRSAAKFPPPRNVLFIFSSSPFRTSHLLILCLPERYLFPRAGGSSNADKTDKMIADFF